MMNLEKFLFKKISLWILILTIIFSIISIILFGSLVLRSKVALKIAQIPRDFANVIKGQNVEGLSLAVNKFNDERGLITFSIPTDFEYKYLLLARYDGDLKRSVVELVDLKKEKIIHTWKPDIDKILSHSKIPGNLKDVVYLNGNNLKNGELVITETTKCVTKEEYLKYKKELFF